MRLRLSPSPTPRRPRNVEYTPGRDFRLPYPVELDPGDYPLGTTLVSALLVAEADFGLAPLVIKTITAAASASGQITDTGTDGVGALYFAFTPGEMTALAVAPVGFEVIVVDSLGRQAPLDIGSLVPTESTAGKPVDHIVVTPDTFSVQDPGTEQLTVTAFDIDGNVLTGRLVNWTSSDPATASIDATGLVTGIGAGNVLFTATIEGKSDTSTGTFITNVTTVGVAPNPAGVLTGQTVQLTATARDAGGVVVPNQVFVWQSSNPAVATVNQAGLVTGVAMGTATISATVNGTVVTGSTVTTVTLSNADFVTLFNAAGAGGAGASFGALYVYGVNQTITPNGASPTGYYCSSWDDAVNPGQGKHWRPAAGFANGAPCLVTGEIVGEGLELPTSTGLCTGPADTSGGTTLVDSPGSSLADYLTDHSKGVTWGMVSRQAQDTTLFTLGEDASGDFLWLYSNESGSNWEPMADPQSGYVSGTAILHFAFWSLKNTSTTGPLSGTKFWAGHRVGRDLFREVTDFGDPTVARRVRLLHPRGTIHPNNATSAVFAFYVLVGRTSRVQMKLINDWADQRWTMYEDTRRLGIQLGDSYQDGYPIQNVSRGFNGAPHVPNFSMLTFATGGNNVAVFQYPKINWTIRDMDFSKRPAGGVVVIASEYLNGGSLAQNYYWADKLRAEDPKVRVVMWNDTSNNNVSANANNTDLDAHAVQDGHASALIDFWRGVQNSLYNFSTGAPNKVPVLWLTSGADPAQHPAALLNEYWYAFFRNNILAALGEDDSARTMKINTSVDNVSLSAGTPTHQIVPTPKSRAGATLSKALTYTTGNAGVATVNGTGLVTRVAAGQTYIKIVSDDGGEGVLVVNCS